MWAVKMKEAGRWTTGPEGDDQRLNMAPSITGTLVSIYGVSLRRFGTRRVSSNFEVYGTGVTLMVKWKL